MSSSDDDDSLPEAGFLTRFFAHPRFKKFEHYALTISAVVGVLSLLHARRKSRLRHERLLARIHTERIHETARRRQWYGKNYNADDDEEEEGESSTSTSHSYADSNSSSSASSSLLFLPFHLLTESIRCTASESAALLTLPLNFPSHTRRALAYWHRTLFLGFGFRFFGSESSEQQQQQQHQQQQQEQKRLRHESFARDIGRIARVVRDGLYPGPTASAGIPVCFGAGFLYLAWMELFRHMKCITKRRRSDGSQVKLPGRFLSYVIGIGCGIVGFYVLPLWIDAPRVADPLLRNLRFSRRLLCLPATSSIVHEAAMEVEMGMLGETCQFAFGLGPLRRIFKFLFSKCGENRVLHEIPDFVLEREVVLFVKLRSVCRGFFVVLNNLTDETGYCHLAGLSLCITHTATPTRLVPMRVLPNEGEMLMSVANQPRSRVLRAVIGEFVSNRSTEAFVGDLCRIGRLLGLLYLVREFRKGRAITTTTTTTGPGAGGEGRADYRRVLYLLNWWIWRRMRRSGNQSSSPVVGMIRRAWSAVKNWWWGFASVAIQDDGEGESDDGDDDGDDG